MCSNRAETSRADPSGDGSWHTKLTAACAASPTDSDAFLSLALDPPETQDGQLASASAALESARRAQSVDEARLALNMLGVKLREAGTLLGQPRFYVASAEAFDRLAALCGDDPDCRRALFVKIGGAFVDAGRWHGDTTALDEALRFLGLALDLTKADDTDHMTSALNEIGNAYSYDAELRSGRREREDLDKAAQAYQRALVTIDRGPHDQDWAMMHHNLGTVDERRSRSDDPGASRNANLDQAIAEYERALTVWTPTSEPDDWASANDNLGGAIFARGQMRGSRADLDQGVAILRKSLAMRVTRKQAEPLPWAYSGLGLAKRLSRRAGAAVSDEARSDRAEAIALIDAVKPVLTAAKATHYLDDLRRLREDLAAGAAQ